MLPQSPLSRYELVEHYWQQKRHQEAISYYMCLIQSTSLSKKKGKKEHGILSQKLRSITGLCVYLVDG
jgi:hypothetical protein